MLNHSQILTTFGITSSERSEKYYFLSGFSFVNLKVDRMLFHLLFFPVTDD